MSNCINTTFNPNGGTLAQQNWKAIAGVAGDAVSADKGSLALYLFYRAATSSTSKTLFPTFALICDFIALALLGVNWVASAPPLVLLALVLGLLGLLFSGVALATPTDATLRPFAEVDFGLSVFSDGVAGLKWLGLI